MDYIIGYILSAVIVFGILYAVIRSSVRAALMDHHEAVQRLSDAPLDPAGPPAPLKWWQR